MRVASCKGVRSTNHAPSENSSTRRNPSSVAMRVFPIPPGPVIVINRCPGKFNQHCHRCVAANEGRNWSRQTSVPIAAAVEEFAERVEQGSQRFTPEPVAELERV